MPVSELDAKIIYCIIAHAKHSIIAQHAYLSGTYNEATNSLLPTIPYDIPETMRCYQFDEFMYYYLVDERKTTFLCLTDAAFSKYQAFDFLKTIRSEFKNIVPKSELDAPQFQLPKYSRSLKQLLKEKINYYNDNPAADKIKFANKNMEDIKVVMLSNIDKALDIGKATDVLASETSNMNENARRFRNYSRRMRNKVIFNNICLITLVILLILIILGIIFGFFCGLTSCFSWFIPNRSDTS